MADHPNATLVREAFRAATQGDPDATRYLADGIEWHEIGRSDPIVGKEAVLAHLSRPTEWSIQPVLHDAVAGDDHAVALIIARARRGGETLEYRVAEIYDVLDGKVSKRWAFSDDTERIAAFFA